MRVISTKMHGVTELLTVAYLLAMPNLFGFEDMGGPGVIVPRVVAGMIIALGLMTRYEYGLIKVVSMVNHLRIDYLAAAFLALSPFIFDFGDEDPHVWLPHLLGGVAYLATSMMSRADTYEDDTRPAKG